MIGLTIKAIIGVTAILGGWLAVQSAWRHFTAAPAGSDALAGRLGCRDCACGPRCENVPANRAEEPES